MIPPRPARGTGGPACDPIRGTTPRRRGREVVEEPRVAGRRCADPVDRRPRRPPATPRAAAMAIRWSPRLRTGPAASRPAPRTTRSSPTTSASAPNARTRSATPASRSRLLDPQLADVPERRLAGRRRRRHGQDRHLVERGDLGRPRRPCPREAARPSRSPSRSSPRRSTSHLRPHPLQDADEADPGRAGVDALDRHRAARARCSRPRPRTRPATGRRARRRRAARSFDGRSRTTRPAALRLDGDVRAGRRPASPRCGPGWHRLVHHRLAVGRESGEQDRRLHLGAGHRRRPLDPASAAPPTTSIGGRHCLPRRPRPSPPSPSAARRRGPSAASTATRRRTGRRARRARPTTPASSRIAGAGVPAVDGSAGGVEPAAGDRRPSRPVPRSPSAPSCDDRGEVRATSSPSDRPRITETPSASAPSSSGAMGDRLVARASGPIRRAAGPAATETASGRRSRALTTAPAPCIGSPGRRSRRGASSTRRGRRPAGARRSGPSAEWAISMS